MNIVRKYLTKSLLYKSGLLILGAGLAWGNFLMSAGTGILLLWLLLQGKSGLKAFSGIPQAAYGAFLIFLLALLPALSHGFSSGVLQDLRIKLPLVLMPLVMMHPRRPEVKLPFVLFWLGLVVLAAFVTGQIMQIGNGFAEFQFRKLSPFISNVRMGTLSALTAVLLVFTAWPERFVYRAIKTLLIAGLVLYMLALQTFTGLGLFLFFVILLLLRFPGFSRLTRSRIFAGVLLSAVALLYGLRREWNWVRGDFPEHSAYMEFGTFSADGYPLKYPEPSVFTERENGFAVWANIAPGSLNAHWESFSTLPLNGKTHNGHELYFTLVRYLSSKGLSKDLSGLKSLSADEIRAIENGTANVLQLRYPGIVFRTNQMFRFLQDYIHTGNPQHESLCIRLEIWRLHLRALTENIVSGYGPGGVEKRIGGMAEEWGSKLSSDYFWLQSHQQFLSAGLYYGIPGLVLFCIAWIWMGWRKTSGWQRLIWLFYTFAMLGEDVLHTQAGVTQLLFFFCLMQPRTGLNEKHVSK
jgi:hypothetical protein